jgi:predicted RNase H-like HicB family nuclease
MTSYVVQVVVEPDEDVWRAYVPDLESRGAATWGQTRDEALRNIQEVARMIVEELIEEHAPLPDSVRVSPNAVVAVTV